MIMLILGQNSKSFIVLPRPSNFIMVSLSLGCCLFLFLLFWVESGCCFNNSILGITRIKSFFNDVVSYPLRAGKVLGKLQAVTSSRQDAHGASERAAIPVHDEQLSTAEMERRMKLLREDRYFWLCLLVEN